jgi:hypothetical protein
VPVLIVLVLLRRPFAESVAFGGVKLEMRRAREKLAVPRVVADHFGAAPAAAGSRR